MIDRAEASDTPSSQDLPPTNLQGSGLPFDSYVRIANSLLPALTGLCLLDGGLSACGSHGKLDARTLARRFAAPQWRETSPRPAIASRLEGGEWLVALPLEQSDGQLLGVLCCQSRPGKSAASSALVAREIRSALQPLLDCVHRELAAAVPAQKQIKALEERTTELEWLFDVGGRLSSANDDPRLLETLIDESLKRLDCAYGALWIPEKRIGVERWRGAPPAPARDTDDENAPRCTLQESWQRSRQPLLNWVQLQRRPLVTNGGSRGARAIGCARILAVPVLQDTGGVSGVLAFFNPRDAEDFSSRHVYVARHLGRQAAKILGSQFDIMTGLYTRGGLEQSYAQHCSAHPEQPFTALYFDVDHMHLVNELYGFEIGNELIVRIADLLEPPLLPEGAMAARIAADQFAVLLPTENEQEAADLASRVVEAVARVRIGPPEQPAEVSVSCGVASVVPIPLGLERAIAAAELACKTAKNRGRNRVERYSYDDSSMMRRHRDAIAIGDLRTAMKAGRLLLHAQRIAPLRDQTLPGGYEILLRARNDQGETMLPGPLIEAAARYQLLPTIDRWVVQHALQALVPYRSVLASRGISVSLNVSGQSIADPGFVAFLVTQLKTARLPGDCLTIEITEQAAVRDLARANELIRQLIALGCNIALDDFGTGANSLSYLRALQVARIKIDGSFVREAHTNRRSRAAVRSIVELAAGLAIDTVAEYVESTEIAQEMRDLGVDYAQGYAFGASEPLETLLDGLKADESQRLHRLFLES